MLDFVEGEVHIPRSSDQEIHQPRGRCGERGVRENNIEKRPAGKGEAASLKT